MSSFLLLLLCCVPGTMCLHYNQQWSIVSKWVFWYPIFPFHCFVNSTKKNIAPKQNCIQWASHKRHQLPYGVRILNVAIKQDIIWLMSFGQPELIGGLWIKRWISRFVCLWRFDFHFFSSNKFSFEVYWQIQSTKQTTKQTRKI